MIEFWLRRYPNIRDFMKQMERTGMKRKSLKPLQNELLDKEREIRINNWMIGSEFQEIQKTIKVNRKSVRQQ